MKDKGITNAFLMFIVSLITLAVSLFAWFAVSQEANIGKIIGATADYSAILEFEVKKNYEVEWTKIQTINYMNDFFGNTVPNDQIDFKIDIENNGNRELNINLVIRNLFSVVSYPGFDMLDVYYLKDGLITLRYNDSLIPDEIIPLLIAPDPTPVVKHDQILNLYRFSNLIDSNNNFTILNNFVIEEGVDISVYFSIVYDQNTSRSEYELGVFHLNSIYVYIN